MSFTEHNKTRGWHYFKECLTIIFPLVSCQHFAGAFVDRLLGDRRIRDWPPVLHPYTTLSENTAIIEAFKKTLDPDEKEDEEDEE
jgi:hypothetical protein